MRWRLGGSDDGNLELLRRWSRDCVPLQQMRPLHIYVLGECQLRSHGGGWSTHVDGHVAGVCGVTFGDACNGSPLLHGHREGQRSGGCSCFRLLMVTPLWLAHGLVVCRTSRRPWLVLRPVWRWLAQKHSPKQNLGTQLAPDRPALLEGGVHCQGVNRHGARLASIPFHLPQEGSVSAAPMDVSTMSVGNCTRWCQDRD